MQRLLHRLFLFLPILLAAAPAPGQPPALPDPAPEAPASAAPSLTARFEDMLATQEWTLVKTDNRPEWQPPDAPITYPLGLYLVDAETGARAALKPAAYFVAGERQRWGGRTLGVDWVLVVDGRTNRELSVQGQLKSSTARALTVEAGLHVALTNWIWHDDARRRRPLAAEQTAVETSDPVPFGRAGRQARYPFGVISQPDRAWVLEVDPDEPRVYQITADPATNWLGVRMDMAPDPRTALFPGRASFHLTLRAQTRGGADAFRQALLDFQQRRAGRTAGLTYGVTAPHLNYDPDALAHADFPLTFTPDDPRPGMATPQPIDVVVAAAPPLPSGPADTDTAQQQRLASAGWQPLGQVHVSESDVTLEQFGSATSPVHHLTLSTTSPVPRTVTLLLPASPEPRLLADPASGAVQELPAQTETDVVRTLVLEPGELAVRALFAWSAYDAVQQDYRNEQPATAGGQALAGNLEALAEARAMGADIRVQLNQPVMRQYDHPIALVISNRGADDLILRAATVDGAAGPQPLLTAPRILAAGSQTLLSAFVDGTAWGSTAAWLNVSWVLERGTASAAGAWREQLRLVEPIYANLSTARVVTLDEELELALPVMNRSSAPQMITVSAAGDFAASSTMATLYPGQQSMLALHVRAPEPRPGRLQVTVETADRVCLMREVPLEFLPADASFARDSRVEVRATGDDPSRVRDGDRATGWRSPDAPVAQSIDLHFPEPTAVSEVVLVWPTAEGQPRSGRHGFLHGLTAAGEDLELAEVLLDADEPETRIEFGVIQLKSLQWRQPPGGGHPDQPNLLWLNELEVR